MSPSNHMESLRPDHEVVEVRPTYFIPSATWAAETTSWFEDKVSRKGGPYAQALIETYNLSVHGIFGPMMAEYRTLLTRLTRQDTARQRLIKKLVRAGVPLPPRRDDLTAEELLAILEDFQHDQEAKLKQDNTVGWSFALGAGLLKTLVAWPFFSNVLEGTQFTGLIPTIGGFLGAAVAGTVTTGAIWWWYRSLLNLFPAKPVSGALKQHGQRLESGPAADLHVSLSRSQQTHPAVSGILLVILTAALVFLWQRWREVDLYTLTNRLGVTGDVAVAMASALVSLLMLAALVGVLKKEGHAQGKRRIDEATHILREWMSEEIATLYDSQVDRDTYNAICTKKDWAAQRILCIGMLVLWKDTTREDIAEAVRNEILSLKEEAGRPMALQFA